MDRAEIALAGLLLNIGKFYQRAEGQFESLEPGDYEHNGGHATWSAAFVQDLLPEHLASIASTVLNQHQPSDVPGKAVALASRLASGERADQAEEQPRNLLSIFCQIGEDEKQRPAPAYLPLAPLELDENVIFPREEVDGSQQAYRSLWDEFVQAVQSLDAAIDAAACVESLYHLLMRYAWSVPSAFYRGTPDISLFDHSRVTSALAVCLTDQDEGTLDALLAQSHVDQVPVAYLVEGDMSGVQRFIYTITSKGAAKGLRGRSLYLQLLTEGIARWMLREMGLPITNLVYVGGGHFYMLIPPSEVARLEGIQHYLDDLMLRHHDGALYVALGAVPLYADDFQATAFGAKWREVGQAVGEAKRRRFAETPGIFDPRGHGGNEETECQVCHAERLDVEWENADDLDAPPVRKCALCSSLEDLGWALGQASYLLLGETEPDSAIQPGEWRAMLHALGLEIALLDEQGDWVPGEPHLSRGRPVLLGLREYPPEDVRRRVNRKLGRAVASGIRFTANVTPRKDSRGTVATFEDLQEASQGLKRLGVLRMDVDDLGHLFGFGFRRADGSSLSTIARVASLSTMMSIFFEGWVGELCRAINEASPQERIYSIYSGGDDLFVVGSWDALPALAYQISRDLSHFAAGNSLVHVSAGITLHGGKHPLYQAAQQAARALDSAKDLDGKNAITFLGQSLHWPDFAHAAKLCERLLAIQQEPQVGRSLFHLLGQLYTEYQSTRRHARNGTSQYVYGPWMWHSAYLLSRLAERVGESAAKEIRQLRDDLLSDIEVIGLAARWAEALTKPSQSSREAQ